METRVKKLLHRHHDQDAPLETNGLEQREPTSVPASPYAKTKPAEAPTTGKYPIHGVRRHRSLNDKTKMFGLRRRGRRSWAPGSRNDYTLHLPPQDTDLSRDLAHLTIDGDDGTNGDISRPRNRHAHDDAGPPVPAKTGRDVSSPTKPSRQTGLDLPPRRVGTLASVSSTRALPPTPTEEHDRRLESSPPDSPESKSSWQTSDPESPRRYSISRKPVQSNAKLPPMPALAGKSIEHRQSQIPPQTATGQTSTLTKPSDLPSSLPINLNNTVDTDVHEQWKPAVTHETVHHEVHHVREERITREIHNHDVFHRILPVIDVQVLPARHFVPRSDGALVEVSESDLPGRVTRGPDGQPRNWFVAETVSRLPDGTSIGDARAKPRQFTARKFEGTEGDSRRWVGEDGVERTETTWVHPPTVEEGGRLTGQTVPMHFGEPREDEEVMEGHRKIAS